MVIGMGINVVVDNISSLRLAEIGGVVTEPQQMYFLRIIVGKTRGPNPIT